VAAFSFDNAYVTVNGTDLSTYARSVTIEVSGDQLDDTAMGDTFRSRIGGLKDWSISIDFNQDFGSSAVDATLFPLLNTVVGVVVNPEGSTTSATNPKYSGNVLVSSYTPVSGSVGDLATTSVSWQGAGTLTRATA